MTQDTSAIYTGKGTVSFGADIGFTVDGVNIQDAEEYGWIIPEETGAQPVDGIILGGMVIVTMTALQWDSATREAMAKHYMSGSSHARTTESIGKLLSEFAQALRLTPSITGAPGWVAPSAVAVRGVGIQSARSYRTRDVTKYALSFVCLPNDDGEVFTEG